MDFFLPLSAWIDRSAAGEEVTAAAAWITRLVCWLCLSSCETVRIETAGAGVRDNGPAAETQKMKTASFSADFMALRPICRSLSCSAVPVSRLLWKVANSNLH